jgi:hypothetical protein
MYYRILWANTKVSLLRVHNFDDPKEGMFLTTSIFGNEDEAVQWLAYYSKHVILTPALSEAISEFLADRGMKNVLDRRAAGPNLEVLELLSMLQQHYYDQGLTGSFSVTISPEHVVSITVPSTDTASGYRSIILQPQDFSKPAEEVFLSLTS